MADLGELLDEIHQELVLGVLEDLRNGDKTARRDALQLLKQNAVTANLSEADTTMLRSRMAAKLDFSALKDKANVVPIVRPDDAATA